jgi:hypothetical protein
MSTYTKTTYITSNSLYNPGSRHDQDIMMLPLKPRAIDNVIDLVSDDENDGEVATAATDNGAMTTSVFA